MTTMTRPGAGEFAPFYAGYVEKAGNDPIGLMERQIARFRRLGETLTDAQATHRYAPGKWSVREVLGHLIDGERVFSYRALRIARGDTTPLAGFDLTDEMAALRTANLAMFRSFDAAALERIGTANDVPVSVRALTFILAGHTEHHLGILTERYGIPV